MGKADGRDRLQDFDFAAELGTIVHAEPNRHDFTSAAARALMAHHRIVIDRHTSAIDLPRQRFNPGILTLKSRHHPPNIGCAVS
jgi:hypothetical protein